jgi:hypothetical protein
MRRLLATWLAGAALTALAATTAIAQPANDDIANARAFGSVPFADALGTADATTEAGEPSDCAGAGRTVWYRFTPTASRPIQLDTIGSDYDTTLAVFTGTPGALEQIACNDDAVGLQSRVTFNATAGVTYLIQVGACCGNEGGSLRFAAAVGRPPLELTIRLRRDNPLDARTRVARIGGTVTCSRRAPVSVGLNALQRAGRFFIRGSGNVDVDCRGRRGTPFEIPITGDIGRLAAGKIRVDATANGCAADGQCDDDAVSGTVRLERRP